MHVARYCFAFCLTLFALTARAQQATVQVAPAIPTSTEAVRLIVNSGGYWMGWNVTRTGNHFRISLTGCMITCTMWLEVNLGLLPAGTYTYEFVGASAVVPGGSFVVAGDVPTLSPAALAAVFVLLAAGGWLAVGRHP